MDSPRLPADRIGSQICHCEAPKGPWQSRSTQLDDKKASANSRAVAGDSHVASLLGMTNLGVSCHKIHALNIASLQGAH